MRALCLNYITLGFFFAAIGIVSLVAAGPGLVFAQQVAKKPLTAEQKRLLGVADGLLEEAQISYVYGGYQAGDSKDCERCKSCLEKEQPQPKMRLAKCSVCKRCSLDCSHFTELVHREAGFPYPYIETAGMLAASAATLLRSYGLVDLGQDIGRSQPGDLLVYHGHVVLLEKRHKPVAGMAPFRGDIVHATGGRDIKTPGEGIQRERFVDLLRFRGSLRRILRHKALHTAHQ